MEAMSNWEKFLKNSQIQILEKEKSVLQGEAGNQEWIYCLKKI